MLGEADVICDQGAYLHCSLLIAGMLVLVVVRSEAPIVQRGATQPAPDQSRIARQRLLLRQVGEARHE